MTQVASGNGKQSMRKNTGTYQVKALIPTGYTIPDSTWKIDSSNNNYMTKTVTVAKNQVVYVDVNFKNKDGSNITDTGQLTIRNQFTADVYV